MNDDDAHRPTRHLMVLLAYHLRPDDWRPFFADIELGKYRGFAEALLKSAKPLPKKARGPNYAAEREAGVQRMAALFHVIDKFDDPEPDKHRRALLLALEEYRGRPYPANLWTALAAY